jgi:cytochrome d ubiquinol oxidase subunit II
MDAVLRARIQFAVTVGLAWLLVIALVGMPIVIAYTIVIYRVFKGKVRLDEYSY